MMAAIFGMSTRSELPWWGYSDWLSLLVSKGGHLGEYALLAVLWRRALGSGARATWWAWAIAVAFAASDELHQWLVPGRQGRLTDVAIDATGAAVGLLVLSGLSRWLPRRGDVARNR